MSWGVRLSPRAEGELFQLGIPEAQVVSFNLFRLAEDQIELSTPSVSVNPIGQEYTFQHSAGGTTINFTVSYRYNENWETLLILRIERELVA